MTMSGCGKPNCGCGDDCQCATGCSCCNSMGGLRKLHKLEPGSDRFGADVLVMSCEINSYNAENDCKCGPNCNCADCDCHK